VFGDLHGQFYDMLNMIDKAGPVTSYKYLFLGDYVDRGTFGCECVLYLMALKINYPKSVFLLRGNHESRLLAEHFNFKAEAVYKYNEDIYNKIQECFDTLPLAAVLTGTIGRFFCVHGGLSPEAPTIKEINEVDRFREPPEKGPFCDLLWSDPAEESAAIGLTALQLARWHAKTFEPNPTRGCSYFYGYGAVKDFLTKNNFSCIVRAHEVQKQGYKLHKFKKFDLKQPPVITVFSAPNYCDMYENWAAWLVFEDTSYTFGQVAWVDHPYYLPNFSNAVAFTFPFVVENFMKVLADVLTAIGQIGFEREQAELANKDEFQMAEEVTQNRVRAMGRIAIMMKKLRLEREANIKATALGGGGDKYDLALRMDLSNEKRPVDARKRFQTM
jgi:serine/threonine-protein phosphatase 2B catalytic subunit